MGGRFLATNFGTARMLDWLKRKAAPAPSGQMLESEGQRPLTDERLERLLGRLGPDGRTRGEPVVAALRKIDPPPSADGMAARVSAAEALKEVDPPPPTDSITVEAPATKPS